MNPLENLDGDMDGETKVLIESIELGAPDIGMSDGDNDDKYDDERIGLMDDESLSNMSDISERFKQISSKPQSDEQYPQSSKAHTQNQILEPGQSALDGSKPGKIKPFGGSLGLSLHDVKR